MKFNGQPLPPLSVDTEKIQSRKDRAEKDKKQKKLFEEEGPSEERKSKLQQVRKSLQRAHTERRKARVPEVHKAEQEPARRPTGCPGYCGRAEFIEAQATRKKRLEEANAEFWRLFHARDCKYLFALLERNLEREQHAGCLVARPEDLAQPIAELLRLADEGKTFELRVVEV